MASHPLALPTTTESLAALSESVLQALLATVVGHRSQAESLGFSPTAAESMAVTVHGVLLLRLFNIDSGGSPCPTCNSTPPPRPPQV